MRRRFGLSMLLGFVLSLLVAAPASACAIANLRLDPSAGPGDTVSYSISGIEPGASYSFTIAGITVSGTNAGGDNGVSGTFTMPDLGSQPQTLTADGQCNCPDGSESPGLIASMRYLQPPPAATTNEPSAGTTSPPTASAQAAENSSRPSSHHPARPTVAAKHQRHASSPAGTAIANSVGSGSGSSQPSSETGSAKQAAQHSAGQPSSIPHQVLRALGSTTSVGPAKVPTMGLLMFALIFTLGTALTASFIYLSQRARLDPKAALKAPAPLPADPVEAELQEMIGDEMAKQLLADLELGEAVSPLAE